MKKRLVIFMMALLMLFGGIAKVNATEGSNVTINIINDMAYLYDYYYGGGNPTNDEIVNVLQQNVKEYVVSNPNIVGDKYIYIGMTELEHDSIKALPYIPIIVGGDPEGRRQVSIESIFNLMYTAGSSMASLKNKFENAEIRDVIIDENGQKHYDIPTGDDADPYYIILPVKISKIDSNEDITENNISVKVDNAIIDPIVSNTTTDTKNTNTNSSETKKATTTAASKKTVKNPKTGDVLFTILGTITLAGAGFVVTLKKAKQR